MLIAGLVIYVGLVALALLKNRHLHQLWPGLALPAWTRKTLSTAGWSLLTVAAIYLIAQRGVGNGLVEYFAAFTVAGLILVVQFSYSPRSVLALGIFASGGATAAVDDN